VAINKAWHEAHRMPKNATVEQRIAWHEGHMKHCACRPVAESRSMLKKLAAELERRR
jgi:hypothetical protein